MPRLSVKRRKSGPVIQLTWPGIALGLAAFVLWTIGEVWLAEALGIDLDCLDNWHGRRALLETVVCTASAGPSGWLVLVVFAAPFGAFAWWLRSKLRAPRRAAETGPDEDTPA